MRRGCPVNRDRSIGKHHAGGDVIAKIAWYSAGTACSLRRQAGRNETRAFDMREARPSANLQEADLLPSRFTFLPADKAFPRVPYMAIIAISEAEMRSVNVAKLKDQLSKYLAFARSGEEIVIRDRNLPVAKLVPLSAEEADDQELKLVAEGKMRLPQKQLDIEQLLKISSGTVAGNKAIEALLAERDEEL